MISRTWLAWALIASLLVPGAVAWADDNPDSPSSGGESAGGGGSKDKGDKKDDDKKDDKKKDQDGGFLGGGMMMPLLLIGGLMLMIMMSGRGRKKQKAKLDGMLAALKKGDKVRTIGGILGSVVEVREDEVVLRIDDNANTRMRVIRRAVSGLVVDGKKDDESAR
jgi:preprotein translocase subunit YajC